MRGSDEALERPQDEPGGGNEPAVCERRRLWLARERQMQRQPTRIPGMVETLRPFSRDDADCLSCRIARRLRCIFKKAMGNAIQRSAGRD